MQMDNYHQHLYVPGQVIDKPKTKWIWKVFWILLAVTSVEVTFAFANGWELSNGERHYLSAQGEKFLFIALTLVKAYYIVFSFMHLGDEKANFKLTLGMTTIFLLYFVALMMFEGYALRDVQLIRPDFFKRVYHEGHAGGEHHEEGAAGHEGEHHGETAPAHGEESHH